MRTYGCIPEKVKPGIRKLYMELAELEMKGKCLGALDLVIGSVLARGRPGEGSEQCVRLIAGRLRQIATRADGVRSVIEQARCQHNERKRARKDEEPEEVKARKRAAALVYKQELAQAMKQLRGSKLVVGEQARVAARELHPPRTDIGQLDVSDPARLIPVIRMKPVVVKKHVQKEVRRWKGRKAPGPFGTRGEHMKDVAISAWSAMAVVVRHATWQCHKALEGRVPQAWRAGNLSLFAKEAAKEKAAPGGAAGAPLPRPITVLAMYRRFARQHNEKV